MKKDDLTGKRYSRLVVVKEIKKRKNEKIFWECLCDCGNKTNVQSYHLKSGKIKSCGCLRQETVSLLNKTHGMSNTYEHGVWRTMIERCYNKKAINYKNYGARGITVCDRWLTSFENFIQDMGIRPSTNHQIDRINNNKSYNLKNCKWSTRVEQCINRRIRSNNKSGKTGVWSCGDKWKASITINKRRINLGTFKNKKQAILSRIDAEKKYFIPILKHGDSQADLF